MADIWRDVHLSFVVEANSFIGPIFYGRAGKEGHVCT